MAHEIRLVMACAAILTLAIAGPARAQSEQPAPAPASTPTPRLSLRWNPVALVAQRVSADIEVWPTEGLSVLASPFRISTSAGTASQLGGIVQTKIHGTGLELGLRGTFWNRPGKVRVGPFIGAFASYTAFDHDGWTRRSIGFDGGVTFVVGAFHVSGGGGFDIADSDFSSQCENFCLSATDMLHGKGVRPRFLASVGVGF